jgi:hypothetical protein
MTAFVNKYTTTKRTGIPAVPGINMPGGGASEMTSFLRAVKQNLERLENIVAADEAILAAAFKYSAGAIYTTPTLTAGMTFIPEPANGALQYAVNNGAHTWVPPVQNCFMTILVQNGASAGAITTSNFTKVTGTAPVTTTQLLFMGRITVIKGVSWLEWQAMQ